VKEEAVFRFGATASSVQGTLSSSFKVIHGLSIGYPQGQSKIYRGFWSCKDQAAAARSNALKWASQLPVQNWALVAQQG
jgi:hypothetical protein